MKKIIFLSLLVSFLSCKKTEDKPLENTSNKEFDTVTKKQMINSSSSVVDGIYQNSKKDEIFYYNYLNIRPKGLKGKWTNTIATVSFHGNNRATLILAFTDSNNKNLKGVYVMNSYIGKNDGLEVFKYEKVEGDNEEEYFTFSFGDNGKLIVTNLTNGDVFTFSDKRNID